jgi:hypothetical protein
VVISDIRGGSSDDGDGGGGNDVGDPVQLSQQPEPMLAMQMKQQGQRLSWLPLTNSS